MSNFYLYKTPKTKTCAKCSNEFTTKSPTRKYCDVHSKHIQEKLSPNKNINSKEEQANKKPKSISESIKKQVAGKQFFKCANSPNSNLKGLEGYNCPRWLLSGPNQGSFDESNYEIDHILEKSIGGSNDTTNLQALCHSCHGLKTKRFMSSVSPAKSESNNKSDDILIDIKKQELLNKQLETEKLKLETEKLKLENEKLKTQLSQTDTKDSNTKQDQKIYKNVLFYINISAKPEKGGEKNSEGKTIYLPIFKGINITDTELLELKFKYQNLVIEKVPVDKFKKYTLSHKNTPKFTNTKVFLRGKVETFLNNFLELLKKDVKFSNKIQSENMFEVDLGSNYGKVKLFKGVNMMNFKIINS